ncbi:uncharacterized protein ASCRUDRAFT_62946 [Ascoidea rubescens DSM 1968]|uniref:RBR-type E3 ubiquitin transferase n=1 Tax=Ascoidea rubescens DSM 1968 TaxID=1344418 RepID=A0A1D2V934_9ASCO|nr:hypothetical protein ASCRUDRAFT_62946 [Ascoidea rubescens DSM 1968]ODV58069.1 hypothetical protein ASCRUDRAFT_62946 [Ascoidea rubescens DSM 1968]
MAASYNDDDDSIYLQESDEEPFEYDDDDDDDDAGESEFLRHDSVGDCDPGSAANPTPSPAATGPSKSLSAYPANNPIDPIDFQVDILIKANQDTDSSLNYIDHTGYKSFTLNSFIYTVLFNAIDDIKSILNIPFNQALLLLVYFNWNTDSLLDNYYNLDIIKNRSFILNLRLNFTSLHNNKISLLKDSKFCSICCNYQSKFYFLPCNHNYFCINCLRKYIKNKILDNLFIINCPELNCPYLFKLSDLNNLFLISKAKKPITLLYLQKIAKSYIQLKKDYSYCPAPDCNSVIQNINPNLTHDHSLFSFSSALLSSIDSKTIQNLNIDLPIFTCYNNHNYCFNCRLESHFPCPCYISKLWVNKCKDDSETANWINVNTKECPKCISSIEKNGGCNHMTCYKCFHQFCWICLGPWASHGSSYYQCNRYNEDDSKGARDKKEISKKLLKKYIHFFDRFQTHEISIKQDFKIFKTMEKTINNLQIKTGNSYIDFDFLKDSIQILIQARNVLKWSYCLSYYLTPESNGFLIYEQNQSVFMNSIEDLSKLFEIKEYKQILKRKSNFIENTRFVSDRQKKLIEVVQDGLKTNFLSFKDINTPSGDSSNTKTKTKA